MDSYSGLIQDWSLDYELDRTPVVVFAAKKYENSVILTLYTI